MFSPPPRGLLGGHVAAAYLKRRKLSVLWYQDELLTMAKEVGDRLLPAFNTTTGMPYPRVGGVPFLRLYLCLSRSLALSLSPNPRATPAYG